MRLAGGITRWGIVLLMVVALVAPAGATTLMRMDLEKLATTNELIIVGEVVEAHSYWNETGTFILTDVQVIATDVLRGSLAEKELTFTLMGGAVGDLATIIVGGAELEPGHSYVLFLNRENLPGAEHKLTVRDHCQGAFNLVSTADGLRAVSQAVGQPLVPDKSGQVEAAGGVEGVSLEMLRKTIRESAAHAPASTREVR